MTNAGTFNLAKDGNRRTLLIALFRPFSIRMLLKSEAIETITEDPDARIVILVPDPENPELAKLAKPGNVFLERLDMDAASIGQRGSRFRSFLRTVRLYTYNERSGVRLTTRDAMVHEFLETQRYNEISFRGKQFLKLTVFLPRILGLAKFLRTGWRSLEKRLYAIPFHENIFAKYNPDLLVVSSLGYGSDELLMWQARRHNTKIVSIIQSWDNTTNKGYPGAQPDAVIAWSDTMRSEMIELLDISPEKIYVEGIPHWDNYFRQTETNKIDKNSMLRELGLAPYKKTILLSLSSHKMYRPNTDLCQILAEGIQSGLVEGPVQLLIRPHPAYFEADRKWSDIAREELEAFRTIAENYSDHVVLDRLGITRHETAHDIAAKEQEQIKARILTCDVMVNSYSTLAIEAAALDCPIVNIAFGFYKRSQRPIKILDDFNHYRRIIQSGGVRNVYDEAELFEAINAYLKDPTLDREKRSGIVDQEVPVNRGKAGKAVGDRVINLLYEKAAT
jgi:hypothetical protein